MRMMLIVVFKIILINPLSSENIFYLFNENRSGNISDKELIEHFGKENYDEKNHIIHVKVDDIEFIIKLQILMPNMIQDQLDNMTIYIKYRDVTPPPGLVNPQYFQILNMLNNISILLIENNFKYLLYNPGSFEIGEQPYHSYANRNWYATLGVNKEDEYLNFIQVSFQKRYDQDLIRLRANLGALYE